jgi:hypothetical protein
VNRYLTGNPLQVLLEDSDPVIKYLALRDFAVDSEPGISSAYSAMKESAPAREILSSVKAGTLGDIDNFTAHGSGSAWILARAVACGLDRREPVIQRTIDEILTRWQTPSGGISGRWNPLNPDAFLTGEILRIALTAGVSGDGTRRAASWIIEHQRGDGGWLHSPVAGVRGMILFFLFNRSGAGLSLETDLSAASCVAATAACVMALSLFLPGDASVRNSLSRAADFLLSRGLLPAPGTVATPFNSDLDLSIKPGFGFPVFCQYDMLYGLLCIARTGFFNDPRTGPAFNAIMVRQSPAGLVPYENYRRGMMFSKSDVPEDGSRHDRWTTMNFLRALKAAGAL